MSSRATAVASSFGMSASVLGPCVCSIHKDQTHSICQAFQDFTEPLHGSISGVHKAISVHSKRGGLTSHIDLRNAQARPSPNLLMVLSGRAVGVGSASGNPPDPRPSKNAFTHF